MNHDLGFSGTTDEKPKHLEDMGEYESIDSGATNFDEAWQSSIDRLCEVPTEGLKMMLDNLGRIVWATKRGGQDYEDFRRAVSWLKAEVERREGRPGGKD